MTTVKRFYWRGIPAAVILAGAMGAAALAQAPAETPATLLSMGAVSAPPTGEVMVPFYLTPAPADRQVGGVSASIRFESTVVSFLRAEKGFLLDGVNGKVVAQLQKDPKDPAQSLVRLEVLTQGEPRKGLREGLVLSLVFRIEEKAQAGARFPVEFEAASATDIATPPRPVQPLATQPGTIEVITPEAVPYVGCFFFTH